MRVKKWLATTIPCILLSFVVVSYSYAGTQVVDLTAGSKWRATSDGLLATQWLHGNFNPTDGFAAWAPAPSASPPNSTMWNCGSDGTLCQADPQTGIDPTSESFFGFSFNVKPGATVTNGNILMLADDYFELYINGDFVTNNLLDQNANPVSVFNLLSPHFQTGDNVILIRAMDGHQKQAGIDCSDNRYNDPTNGQYSGGPFTERPTELGPFCTGHRANEYLYVQGSLQVVPEPGSVSLMVLGLAGFGLIRSRRVNRLG